MYRLVSDSSCDMHSMEGVPFISVPLTISTDQNTWVDNADIDVNHMMDTLASYKGRSYTSCPNVDAWLSAFEGADPVFAVTITSGLSGSYNSAMTARGMYLETHPDAKIHVFDSLSTGPEMRLLLERLYEWNEQGLPFEEIVRLGDEYLKRARLYFALYSVHNLAQNGRVSSVVAAAVDVIKIRILGTASVKGELETISKVRGDKKLINEFLKQLDEIRTPGRIFRITHAGNPEFAELLKSKLMEKYPAADIVVAESSGLCSFYGERGAIFLAAEGAE